MFPTTNWSGIVAAQRDRVPLPASVAKAYWRPLYLYARYRGLGHGEAEDAVQGLFVRLMQSNSLARLDRARGRLRTFLKAALDHHLADHRDRASAAKRGGRVQHVPLDDVGEPIDRDACSADTAYDRAWARALVQRAFDRLCDEYRANSRVVPLALVQLCFGALAEPPPQAELAQRFAMSVPQIKSILNRARVRFRTLVRTEVLATVSDRSSFADELALIEISAFGET